MGKHEEIDIRSYSKEPERPEYEDVFSSSGKPKNLEKKKKKKKKSRVGLIILSLVLVVVLAVGGLGFYTLGGLEYSKFPLDEDNLAVNTTHSESEVKNIALFGLDSRQNVEVGEDEENRLTGLSDSIMVLSVNKSKNEIKLISIMRDSAVQVDGKWRKINSAYSKGGAELAVKTINESFDLDITDYATVNFFGLAKVIDAVGGVEVEVTQAEIDNKNFGVNAQIREQAGIMGIEPKLVTEPGVQILDGNQAVAWARIRKEKTAAGERDDYGRTARQRTVLNQLLSRAKSSSVFKYRKLLDALMPCIETSLDMNELIPVGMAVILGEGIEQARIPHDNYTQSGKNLVAGGVHYDLETAADMMHKFIYEGKTFDQYAEEDKK